MGAVARCDGRPRFVPLRRSGGGEPPNAFRSGLGAPSSGRARLSQVTECECLRLASRRGYIAIAARQPGPRPEVWRLPTRMPTVLVEGPYRFFFYAGDRDEPLHVHVERDDRLTKFWLAPVRLHSSGGFGRAEISRIRRITEYHQERSMRCWDEYSRD